MLHNFLSPQQAQMWVSSCCVLDQLIQVMAHPGSVSWPRPVIFAVKHLPHSWRNFIDEQLHLDRWFFILK